MQFSEHLLKNTSFKNIPGIYAIRNAITGQLYIGCAENLYKRCRTHRICLRGGYHGNLYLQRSWKKYGENNFEFLLVELTDLELLKEREKIWIKEFHSDQLKNGFNMTEGGDGCPVLCKESRLRRQIACREASNTPEERKRRTEVAKRYWESSAGAERKKETSEQWKKDNPMKFFVKKFGVTNPVFVPEINEKRLVGLRKPENRARQSQFMAMNNPSSRPEVKEKRRIQLLQHNPMKGRIWIRRGLEEQTVSPTEFLALQNAGWEKGRIPITLVKDKLA